MNKSKKVIKPNVVGGGVAIPLGNNFYFMRGRKHEQGGIDVGPNNENGLEVEGGEVMQMGGKHVKVYSSLPILNGKSPAELVIAGLDPDRVFNAQERFKDVNKLNDDGSRKAKYGIRKKAEVGTMWIEDEFGNVIENDEHIIPEPYSKDKPIKSKPIKDIAYRIMTQMPGADRNLSHVVNAIGSHLFKSPVPLHYTGGASSWNNNNDDFHTWENPNRNLAKLYLTGEAGGIEQIPDNSRGFDYTNYLKKNKYKAKTYKGEILPDEVTLPKGYEYLINNMASASKSNDAYNFDHEFDDIAHHKQQIGRDEKGNLEIQASDVWDFQPDDYSKIWNDKGDIKKYTQAWLLDKVGNPFILRDYSKIKFADDDNKVNIPNSVKHWLYEYPIKKEDINGMPHYSLEHNDIEMIFDKNNINKKPIVWSNSQTYKPEKRRLGGTNRHFTINGNIINKAGYIPSTGEQKKDNMDNISKRQKAEIGKNIFSPRGLGIQATMAKMQADAWDKKHSGEDNPFAQQFIDDFGDPTIYSSIMSDNANARRVGIDRGYRGNIGLGWSMPELPNINLDNYFNNQKDVIVGGGSSARRGYSVSSGRRPETKTEELKSTLSVKPNVPTQLTIKTPEIVKTSETKTKNKGTWWRDNGSDLISGLAKGGASLASYLINRDMLNNLKYSGQPVFTPATKLKTKININPQIDAINRTIAARNRVAEESASSKVRNARINANYIDRLGYLNELYGMKENKETELINADKLNQQEITKGNIQAYNDWVENKQNFDNTIREKQSENAVSFVSNLASGVDDILTNRQKRKQFKQNVAAYMASHPNVSPELLETYGLDIFNHKTNKSDKRKTKIRAAKR